MPTSRGRIAFRGLTIAALASLWAVCPASASPMKPNMTYRTTGTVGDLPGSAWNPVLFRGIDDGTLVASQTFSLGEFEVAPSAHGPVDMPFVITFQAKTVDGVAPEPNDSPVILQGRIVGTLDDGGQSVLRALFDQGPQFADPKYYNPRAVPPFQVGNLISTLTVNGGSEFLTLATSGSARTTIEARLDVTPVPEPTALAVFGLAGICMVLRIRYGRLATQ